MQPKVFCLLGQKNSGKTTTIRRVFELLLPQGAHLYGGVARKEVHEAVLKIDGVKIGIDSRGDDPRWLRQ